MLVWWILCSGSTTWPLKKQGGERTKRFVLQLDFPQVEVLPGPYRITVFMTAQLCLFFLLHFPWSSLGKKKNPTKNFLTSLSLHWNPETFGSAFKNPLISILLKKYKILFVQLRPICTYTSIGNATQKTNNISRGLHSISFSTQPGFYSCSFSFSPLGCPFFKSSIFMYSEEDILPASWRENDIRSQMKTDISMFEKDIFWWSEFKLD